MIFGLLLILTFVNVFPGAGTSPRWMLLSLMIPLIILVRDLRVSNAHLGILFLLYASISSAWAPDLKEGMQDVWKIYLLAGAFVIGAGTHMRAVFIGCALGFAINSAVVVAQVYGFDGITQTVAPAGLFSNKNFGGEAAALVLIALVGYRLWWLAPLPLVTLVLSGSKAGVLAAAIGVLFVAPGWMRWSAAALAVFGVSLVSTDFDGHFAHLLQRTDVWTDMLNNLTLFGHGAGSFYILMPGISVHNVLDVRFDFAHNDWLQLVFEYGIGVIPLAVLLGLAWWRGTCNISRAVLAGFIVEGCFGFPLHLPVTGVLALLCAGRLFGSRLLVRSTLLHGQPVLRGGHAHG